MLAKKWIKMAVCLPLVINLGAQAVWAADKLEFKLEDNISIGGDGRWDYLSFDAQQKRLFISRSTHVQVLDLATHKIIGDIPNTLGVHGIALANEFNRGFTSNGKDNSVTVFDLTTFATVATIKVSGADPDDIIYDPIAKQVFAFNGKSSNVSVIDAQSLKEVATIALGGTPETAVLDGNGKIFVNLEDKNTVVSIDIASHKVLKSFSLGAGDGPTGLAIDTKNKRLFATCSNKKMVILNAVDGKIIATLDIDSGTDAAAFDPELGLAFSSNGSGTLSVIQEVDANHFANLQTLPTQKGARTMAYDTATHTAYLATAAWGETPAPTAENQKPKPAAIPNSFSVLKVGLSR